MNVIYMFEHQYKWYYESVILTVFLSLDNKNCFAIT
jgi:hypothetical protein